MITRILDSRAEDTADLFQLVLGLSESEPTPTRTPRAGTPAANLNPSLWF